MLHFIFFLLLCREDYGRLYQFVCDKQLRIKNKGKVCLSASFNPHNPHSNTLPAEFSIIVGMVLTPPPLLSTSFLSSLPPSSPLYLPPLLSTSLLSPLITYLPFSLLPPSFVPLSLLHSLVLPPSSGRSGSI